MCLAVPLRIITLLDNDMALAGDEGGRLRISLSLLDEPVHEGDHVLIHAGFAIARVAREEAEETIAMVTALRSSDSSESGGERA